MRHLKFERTNEHLKELEKFCEENNNKVEFNCSFFFAFFPHPLQKTNAGQPYEKSFGTLIKANSKSNKNEDQSSFFCSELVVALLKAMGLVDVDVISSNFLPRDLAKNDFSTVLKGANLEELQIYDQENFNKHFGVPEEK